MRLKQDINSMASPRRGAFDHLLFDLKDQDKLMRMHSADSTQTCVTAGIRHLDKTQP